MSRQAYLMEKAGNWAAGYRQEHAQFPKARSEAARKACPEGFTEAEWVEAVRDAVSAMRAARELARGL